MLELQQLSPGSLAGCALTIGNFDGVHLGHREILKRARALVGGDGRVAALTFDPHPLAVLRPGQAPPPLTTLPQRIQLLTDAGADHVVVAHSAADLLQLEAETFVKDIIVGRIGPSHVIEGRSFGFGRDRRGTPDLLRTLGENHGFTVLIVEPVLIDLVDAHDVVVSSSLVRTLVAGGDVEAAGRCLGRPHEIEGIVGHGQARGRELGFPTVNLEDIAQLIPAEGVYGGTAQIGAMRWAAAISVGRTPTFDEAVLQIEAHLLDFDDEVYDRPARLRLHKRLRAQQRFESPDELMRQINTDVQRVREGASQWL